MTIRTATDALNTSAVLIGAGIFFSFFSAGIFLFAAFNGFYNGGMLFGGGALGLLMVCVGYLKRISEALAPKVAAADIGSTGL